MTIRVLPRADWATVLAGTELGSIASLMPEEAIVMVCEEADGTLLGCWSLVKLWQAEGLWIAPSVRGNAAVGRGLLLAMKDAVSKLGTHVILSAAAEDDRHVQRMLDRAGASALPVKLYQWPMGSEN